MNLSEDYARDYGTGDWEQIKANFPRKAFGMKLVSVEDRVPPKPLIQDRSVRKRVLAWVLAVLGVLGVTWLVSPLAFFILAGLMIAACWFAAHP